MLILLRLIHIVIGILWVGGIVFVTMFVLPSTRATGQAGGVVMQDLMMVRKVPVYFMGAGLVTILSGLSLLWIDSAGFTTTWVASGPGRTFSLGAAFAIIALLLGASINAPTAKKLAVLGATMQATASPPAAGQIAEMERLRARLTMATRAAAMLVLLAAACMASARYVPA